MLLILCAASLAAQEAPSAKPLTIDELLDQLANWPPRGTTDYDSALQSASRLMRAAALTIRQLRAVIEATEEAIINSLFAAETLEGKGGRTVEALPKEKVLEWVISKRIRK